MLLRLVLLLMLSLFWTNCFRDQAENLSHLLDLIAIELQRFIYEEVETVKLLEGSVPSRTVLQCLRLIAKWTDQTTDFTTKIWLKFPGRKFCWRLHVGVVGDDARAAVFPG
jgi:hypothetical protein